MPTDDARRIMLPREQAQSLASNPPGEPNSPKNIRYLHRSLSLPYVFNEYQPP